MAIAIQANFSMIGAEHMKPAYVLLTIVLFIYPAHSQTGSDSIFIQTYTDSVCISNINITTLCGACFITTRSISGDSVTILESDTSRMHAWCMCNYDVRVTLYGLSPGTYRVFVFRNQLFPLISTHLVGSITFTVTLNGSPEWLTTLIAKFQSELVTNPPREIWRYKYMDQIVYYVPPICCDQYSVLYDTLGNIICAPDGGITGQGDGRCPGFFTEAKNGKLIWQDQRSLSLHSSSYITGCHEPIINSVEEIGFTKTFSLFGNYPNPFNPVTIIRYQIHRRSNVRLEIFDELGRVVTTLINEEKPLGDYEVVWNASKLSSGIYLCKLTVGNEIQTHKMTLLK
jgi:hypothetical protein